MTWAHEAPVTLARNKHVLIVDRLFAAAELTLGTVPQHVVRIVRTDAVWRETTQ